jgi:hypothetical protein
VTAYVSRCGLLRSKPAAAIEPGEVAVNVLRRLRTHDRVSHLSVGASGVIDVLADCLRTAALRQMQPFEKALGLSSSGNTAGFVSVAHGAFAFLLQLSSCLRH